MNINRWLMVGVLAIVLGMWGCREDTDVAEERGAPTAEEGRREAGEALAAADFGDAMDELREAYEDFVRTYRTEREAQPEPTATRG